MTYFLTLLLLYAYFRFFDFRLLAGERLQAYSLRRVLFTAHDTFRDPILSDPVAVAVHPSKAWWAFLRPIIVIAPVYLAETLSPIAIAGLAAIGLILLVGPLAMPKAMPMRRAYGFFDGLIPQIGAGFNNVIVALALGGVFYVVRKVTGLQVKVDWLFVDLHLFASYSAKPHSEEIAAGAWVVAMVMIFTKSCIWAKAVITQGRDGLGYPPAVMMPIKTDTARLNNLKSLGWGIGGFLLGWMALCFIYNYTALLEGYQEIGGRRTVGVLMILGLLIGHPI